MLNIDDYTVGSGCWTDQELATFQQNNLAGERAIVHQVQDTDTNAGIALYYGITNSELLQWNNLYGTDSLHLKQRLVIIFRHCKNEMIRQKVHEGTLETVTLPKGFRQLDQIPAERTTPSSPNTVRTTDSVIRSVNSELSKAQTPMPTLDHSVPSPVMRSLLPDSRAKSYFRRTLGDLTLLQQEGLAIQQSTSDGNTPNCWDAIFNFLSRVVDCVEQTIYRLIRRGNSDYLPATINSTLNSPSERNLSSPIQHHFMEVSPVQASSLSSSSTSLTALQKS